MSVWAKQATEEYVGSTIPHGSVELVCTIGSQPRFVGPQTGRIIDAMSPGTTTVGLRFRPGAAGPVLGLPAAELVDRDVDATDIWGRSVELIGERIAAAPTMTAAVRVLEEAVWARLVHAPGADPLVVEAVRRLYPWRAQHIGRLSGELDISERQLRRRFQTAVGYSAKTLQRLLRFQGFLAVAQHHDDALGRLAADLGFADQPHLTRESVRLAGHPPSTLLAGMSTSCPASHDHAVLRAPFLRALGVGPSAGSPAGQGKEVTRWQAVLIR